MDQPRPAAAAVAARRSPPSARARRACGGRSASGPAGRRPGRGLVPGGREKFFLGAGSRAGSTMPSARPCRRAGPRTASSPSASSHRGQHRTGSAPATTARAGASARGAGPRAGIDSVARPPVRWTRRVEGSRMKISAFHLMPHRELPADFEQRYESVWVTPPWWELADARRVGQYYNWTLDELLHAARVRLRRPLHQRASPERLRVHAEPEPHGQRAREAHPGLERRHRPDGLHPAHVEPAHPRRRGVRDARLHQRRAAGGRPAARQSDGRQPLLRHHPDGAAGALPGGLRPDAQGLAGPGDLRVERPVLPAGQREPVAAPHPGAPSARCGSRARAASAPSTSPSSTTSATAS